MGLFSQLFCKHNYVVYDTIPCTCRLENGQVVDVPIMLMECEKCGKRLVLKDQDWHYKLTVLQRVDLWKRGFFNWECKVWEGEEQK